MPGEYSGVTFRGQGDPETHTRITQYEMAFRMQARVPELADLSGEPEHVFRLYGEAARDGGSFAHSAPMARRLVERGVGFVQVYHNNRDHHANLAGRMRSQCQDVDQACHGRLDVRGSLVTAVRRVKSEAGRCFSPSVARTARSRSRSAGNSWGGRPAVPTAVAR